MFGCISAGFRIAIFPLVFLPSSISFLRADQVVPSSAQERAEVAGSYVNERLAVWQQRLNLQDWKISIVMAHQNELKPKTLPIRAVESYDAPAGR